MATRLAHTTSRTMYLVFATFIIFSLMTSAANTNATVNISQIPASQLLSHDFLYRYPLENVSVNAVMTLNTLDLCNGIDIEEATIDQLQANMMEEKLSSVQLTTCYMNRVFQIEKYIK